MIWKLIAWIVTRPRVTQWIIFRALQTPYVHIDGYMKRYWVFNAYRKGLDGQMHTPYPWLPNIRVHHILRKDMDDVPHDHPWNARTIILRGGYDEKRVVFGRRWSEGPWVPVADAFYFRRVGDTCTLKFEEYHTVTDVSEGGVWTLFFTWKYQGGWGFWVDGKKVPYREYLEKKL